MNPILITSIILLIITFYFIAVYNSLVIARNRVKEAESSIDVQLKRRIDLIPNLVETVKGYAKHEKELLENITKARAALLSAETMDKKAEANNMLRETLKSLFAVAENYPDLKANQNFLELQRQLEDTEDKISYARQFYNANVLEYNNKIQTFPSNLIANIFGFKPESFFEAEEGEREAVKVKF